MEELLLQILIFVKKFCVMSKKMVLYVNIRIQKLSVF
jgi:hypothetical protein